MRRESAWCVEGRTARLEQREMRSERIMGVCNATVRTLALRRVRWEPLEGYEQSRAHDLGFKTDSL